jgi:hypothetical protein
MKRLLVCMVPIIIATIMLVGCGSKELSRSEAKKILDKLHGDGKSYADFDTGLVFTKHGLSSPHGLEPNAYKYLEKNGIITLQGLGKSVWGNERYAVQIPDDIQKKYVASVKKRDNVELDGKHYTNAINKVLIGTYSVNEITGIRQDGKDTVAKALVEYTVKFKSTPFGRVLHNNKFLEKGDKGEIQVSANFERYDDGWRYVKGSIKYARYE